MVATGLFNWALFGLLGLLPLVARSHKANMRPCFVRFVAEARGVRAVIAIAVCGQL